MGNMLSLSETKPAQIVVLNKKGLSEQKISAKICGRKPALCRKITNFSSHGGYKDLNRSGRPMKTSPEDSSS